MHALFGNGALQNGVQVRAMRRQIRRAVFRLVQPFHRHPGAKAAVVPFQRNPVGRLERIGAHGLAETEGAQDLEGVRSDLHARPDLSQ
jgi:hypothetical protein